jgi:hypothetical protein
MSRRRSSRAERVLARANKVIETAKATLDPNREPPSDESVDKFATMLERDYFARWHSEDSVLTALDNMFAAQDAAASRGKGRRNTRNKRTVFIEAVIELAFDDFPKWWKDHANQSESWRHDQMIRKIRDYLIANSPESETGLSTISFEISESELTIGGKPLTRDQLRRIVPNIVTDR